MRDKKKLTRGKGTGQVIFGSEVEEAQAQQVVESMPTAEEALVTPQERFANIERRLEAVEQKLEQTEQ